ncbi:MAG: DUF1156 domain-containing protein, partial [Syntrophales bacterium]
NQGTAYPKRLIEVDLPIKRISAHARREKSIRHGHISTLHIWWARRPLAACRAVICAALWPDTADPLCPDTFRKTARKLMQEWAEKHTKVLTSQESLNRFIQIQKNPDKLNDGVFLRQALLDFIADFSNWDNSTVKEYLETSRALTQAAHEALGGESGNRPLVVDPFAGGGAIPLEALRVGADAFASDLNPVAVLLNKVVLEYIPKYGPRLADEVQKWGEWIKKEAEKELSEFYPKDPKGATPIAYLWARTIQCEGPGCGAEVPLIRSLWLAKKANRSVALQLVPRPRANRVDFQIIVKQCDKWLDQSDLKSEISNPQFEGTVRRGSATCPCCGYTTPVVRVREQLKTRQGGANDARLMIVVRTRANEQGRFYEVPTEKDLHAIRQAAVELDRKINLHAGPLSLVPDEKISLNEIRRISVPIYGIASWGDMFTQRQLLALTTLAGLVWKVCPNCDAEFAGAVKTMLALAVNKQADLGCALTRWKQDAECPVNLFGRQAIGMVWDFAETVVTSDSSGSWASMFERTVYTLKCGINQFSTTGQTLQCSATKHVLPSGSADAVITDPPYYDAVPYAHLSDFFYVWLRRSLMTVHSDLFTTSAVPKDEEIVVDRPHALSTSVKGIEFYERELTKAFAENRRVLRPEGIGTIVFASKTTASWEAILKAVVDAGWIITGSWPIDTEMESRVAAQGQARLASSIHLVCRPRENPDGPVRPDHIGDWRHVLSELPRRIHDWMPRLAEEGVVGADAIFACLGPALEVFSRYSRVEKASGEIVTLKEFLEHVWAAVAKEALTMIFTDADASGFEEDARITAMWLWTLSTGNNGSNGKTAVSDEATEGEDEESANKAIPVAGYVLEYDAARKIAQGLGVHLDKLSSLVEVKGETARLLPVAERATYLFGKDAGQEPAKRKKKDAQLSLFEFMDQEEQEGGNWQIEAIVKIGHTVLDQLHQGMILFAASRGEALKRFLVEEGIGRDQRFWRLAQAFSALYPSKSDEKRWVDGVLARKKGLGF